MAAVPLCHVDDNHATRREDFGSAQGAGASSHLLVIIVVIIIIIVVVVIIIISTIIIITTTIISTITTIIIMITPQAGRDAGEYMTMLQEIAFKAHCKQMKDINSAVR